MLNPMQFKVNEAWIAFKMNDNPISFQEGEFNAFTIIDAASTYAFGPLMAEARESSPNVDAIDAMFMKAFSEARNWPNKIIIADNIEEENNFKVIANNKGINVERLPVSDLSEFISPIRNAMASSHFPINIIGDSNNNNATHNPSYKDNSPVTVSYSPYAPIRYRDEYWWKFARRAAQDKFITPEGKIAANLPDIIFNELVTPILQNATTGFNDHKDNDYIFGQTAATAFDLRHWVPMIGQYELCGRQIFDLGDELVEMLSHTDFGDCTLQNWHPPYDAFFVRFGKREDMKLPWDTEQGYEYLDGAFIAVSPWDDADEQRRIKIGFSTVKETGAGVMLPGYFIDFTPDEQLIPVNEAIEVALKRRINSFADTQSDDANSKALNSYRRQRVEEAFNLLKQASDLLINSLFYIESVKTEHILQPGRDATPTIVAQWANTVGNAKRKLASKLTKDGYALVYLAGQEFSPGSMSKREHGTKSTHWRRSLAQPAGWARQARY